MSKISVCIPIHKTPDTDFFLSRLLESLDKQTFKDYEVVVTDEGKMAENTNTAIKKATGDIIKILYLDDYLEPWALQNLADNFKGGWYASGCVHDKGDGVTYNPHFPSYSEDTRYGNNTIGSPSVVAFANETPLLFDENLSWLLDCELYGRLFDRYGEPTFQASPDVVIGIHPGQTTNLMSDEEKMKEHEYVRTH